MHPYNIAPDLVSASTEITVELRDFKLKAILDTRSTIGKVFYDQYLSHIPISSLDDLLKIECADGQFHPNEGYIEIEISFTGVGLTVEHSKLLSCLFLIVPSSPYNTNVPVLVGTNILTMLMGKVQQQFGETFLQKAKPTTPMYLAFRCVSLREKELERHNHQLAKVRLAGDRPVIIPPNSETVLRGFTDKELPYPPVCALMQETVGSLLPDDLEITPSLVSYT